MNPKMYILEAIEMFDNSGKLQFSRKILLQFRESYLFEEDDINITHTKCPHCRNIITFTEAHLKPLDISDLTAIPFQDEDGVVIGECIKCQQEFALNVKNPDFSFFKKGASLIGFYFNEDGRDKNSVFQKDKYENHLYAIEKIEGDEDLVSYRLNYSYDEYPLYVCKHCNANLETLSLQKFNEKFDKFQESLNRFISVNLKNGGSVDPEYIIVKNSFACICGCEHHSFFFKKYRETLNVKSTEFAICNVTGSHSIGNKIKPGVYSKSNIVSWIYKLIPRWTIVFDKVYIITPFIGHQYKDPAELTDIWIELINRLDPKKSHIWVKSGELSKFKTAYFKVNNREYDKLNDFDLGSVILSEINQSKDFHAKIYCGVSANRCEVFSGSANLVKGPSLEVMHFITMKNFSDFNESFLAPMGIKEDLISKSEEHSILFDSINDFNTFSTVTSNAYGGIILYNEYGR